MVFRATTFKPLAERKAAQYTGTYQDVRAGLARPEKLYIIKCLIPQPLHRGSVTYFWPCPKLCPTLRVCTFGAASCVLFQSSGYGAGSQPFSDLPKFCSEPIIKCAQGPCTYLLELCQSSKNLWRVYLTLQPLLGNMRTVQYHRQIEDRQPKLLQDKGSHPCLTPLLAEASVHQD